MQIAMIGAGRVASALGARWGATGHTVVYGVRDPDDPKYAAVGAAAAIPAAVRGADVVVLAVPWDAAESVARSLDPGDAVVVDATNPLSTRAGAPDAGPEQAGKSGGELVAAWTGSTRVVKAFNTTGSANMTDPAYPGGRPAMFLAGDDTAAKECVSALAAEIGFDAVDAGPLAAAQDLEHLAALWIRLAYPLGNGPGIAFGLLRR